MKTIIRKNEELARLVQVLAVQEKPLEVEFRPLDDNYTVSQRRQYWVWIEFLMKHSGMHKDDLHKEYKKHHLVPIYERDDQEYALLIEHLRDVYRSGAKDKAETLMDVVVKNTSITTAKKKQMTEYMEAVKNDAEHFFNVMLPSEGI